MKNILLILLNFFIIGCNSDSYHLTPAKTLIRQVKPGAFAITSATQGNSSVILDWSSSPNATSYIVKYGTVSGDYSDVRSNAISPYAVEGLINGVEYFFQVTAVNNNGSVESNTEVSKVAIFLDEFNEPSMNYLWQLGTNPGSYSSIFNLNITTTVSFDGNEVIFGEPGAGTEAQTLETLQNFDITNSWVSTEMSGPPVNDGLRYREGGLWILNSSSDGWEIYKADGLLYSGTYLSNGTGSQTNVAFDPINHKHLRIRHESVTDSIHFEASPDGLVWSLLRTMARGSIPIDEIHFMLYTYANNNGNGPSTIPAVKFNSIKSNAPVKLPGSVVI